MRNYQYFVYIVECSDGLYYIGITNDVETRLWEHNEGVHEDSFTFKRRPVVLRYWQRFKNVHHAIEFEKQVKGWSRKKKEALFNDDWDEIVRLSNFKNVSQSSTGSD
ncbi:MAG: GIY-YIG nuclease family protein [Cyclobacteriaceae bacterium]|nr:GIY-YIG nuclease family protein [Cyclobacteriaceae bacterium]